MKLEYSGQPVGHTWKKYESSQHLWSWNFFWELSLLKREYSEYSKGPKQ